MIINPKLLLTYQKDICAEVVEAITRARYSEKHIPPIKIVSVGLLEYKLNPVDKARLHEIKDKFIIYDGSNRAYEALQQNLPIEASIMPDTPGSKFLPLVWLKDLVASSNPRQYKARTYNYPDIW